MTETLLSLQLSPVWNHIRGVRDDVGTLLADYSAELRSAAAMVASELLENAFKYGEHVPRAPLVSFSMSVRNSVLHIETVSGSTDPGNLAQLELVLRRIAAADDKIALYLDRLRETLSETTDRSPGLGLYRIAAEGEFSLSCHQEDGVLTVLARRNAI